MKRIMKLILGLVIGFVLGFAGVLAGIAFFSDIPLAQFLEKAASISALSIVGVMLASFASLFAAFFLQITLHEGGHLVCGLATGYSFVSFRIGSLTLIRKDGKFQFKRFGVAGTGGQCLLAPPQKPLNEMPTAWYNLGGVLFNLLSSTIALIPIFCISGMPSFASTFLVVFSLTGYFMALMNGIPMKIGGIGNDADNMRLMLKNTASKQALVTQLRVNALMQEGVRLKDMPAEWFSDAENIDYRDALQVSIRMLTASRYEDMGDMDKAYAIFDECWQHKDEIMGLLVKELSCEWLLIALIKGDAERVEALYTKDIKTYIVQYKKIMSGKQVLCCALALYKENDAPKAQSIYNTLVRESDKYLMQGEVQMSIALMEKMLTSKDVR